jgi:integrase
MRTWLPDRRVYREERIGTADDYQDADGVEVLSFAQAQQTALQHARTATETDAGLHYTVDDAVRDYLQHQHLHRKGASDTEVKLKAYVLSDGSPLAGVELAELTPEHFDKWVRWALARHQRRKAKRNSGRTGGNAAKEAATGPDVGDLPRRRKSTLNRVIGALKACLNHAHEQHKVPSDIAWRRLKKFKGVDAARVRWLTEAEAKRLRNACPVPFRRLVEAALLTGMREGELLALRVRDIDLRSGTVLVAASKAGTHRRVHLTDEGKSFFAALIRGKTEGGTVFLRGDGTPWHRVAVIRMMQDACAAGRVEPRATFHELRHTFASWLAQNGVPLAFVAQALGHRDTRMVEKHYGHLAPSQVAAAIQANLPVLDIVTDDVVTDLRSRPRRKRT